MWLTALVDALPANGHVLLASRWSPAAPLARLATQSDLRHLDEDELRFSDDELAEFAARRGVAIERFDDTGGMASDGRAGGQRRARHGR